jgi:hypothetical protein
LVRKKCSKAGTWTLDPLQTELMLILLLTYFLYVIVTQLEISSLRTKEYFIKTFSCILDYAMLAQSQVGQQKSQGETQQGYGMNPETINCRVCALPAELCNLLSHHTRFLPRHKTH